MTSDARRAAEAAARIAYGRLLASLAAWSRDIAGAEDALAEAFVAALRTWPERGIPDAPDAWLLTAARNHLRNRFRHDGIRAAAAQEIERRHDALSEAASFPDERLKLLFVCAHPAIDAGVRTPLMLQTVLGLDAARIASAFLVAPAAMGQRLVRAKAKIRDAGLRFEVPEGDALPGRLGDVLDAVYAAFGTGWDAVPGAATGSDDLAQEAIYLGRLLVELLPDEPEAQGLLALMLYCEARRGARRDPKGGFVPLDRQDARLWSRDLIVEAEGLLTAASRAGRFGRYGCEAAIQSVHVQRGVTGRTNHAALELLYDLLAAHAPGTGSTVGRAAAYLARDPSAALAQLDAARSPATERYQPWWVTRATALAALGHCDEARDAMKTAIGLTEDAAVRAWLAGVMDGWPQAAMSSSNGAETSSHARSPA